MSNQLIAYWPFDRDLIAETGGFNGQPLGSARVQQSALVLNGVGSAVSVLPGASLTRGSQITLAAWIKTTSRNTMGIIKRGASDVNKNEYALKLTSGFVRFIVGGSQNQPLATITYGGLISNGGWHLVMGIVRANGRIELWVDGALRASVTKTIMAPPPADVELIGASSLSREFFIGQIDEVKIWNYALTAAEILAEFKRTHCGGCLTNQFFSLGKCIACSTGKTCQSGQCL